METFIPGKLYSLAIRETFIIHIARGNFKVKSFIPGTILMFITNEYDKDGALPSPIFLGPDGSVLRISIRSCSWPSRHASYDYGKYMSWYGQFFKMVESC